MKTTKLIARNILFIASTALFLLNSPAQAAIAIQHWTLANGAQVYLVPSPSIPMVDVQIDFDAGARRDPAAQAGLAEVTAGMVDKGLLAQGADPALDENAVGAAWADLGASFGAGAGQDRMSFSMRSLTDPALLGQAAALAAREIAGPAFEARIWERERQRLVASLEEADRRPGTAAAKAYARAVYASHPYGQITTAQTLASISVDDMRALYQRSILPCRASVSLVGALDRAQAEALVQQLLARLPQPAPDSAACAALPAVPEVAPLSAPQTLRIPFDAAQAHVLMGQPGFKRDDPDYFPLIVGNYILGGGGFVSRLTEQVRQQRALSYSVYSYFAPSLHAGAFTVGLETRPDQAQQALDLAREVVAKFVAEGPTEAELRAAKDYMVGGFALRIDSNRKLLDNVANIAWNHLPLNYLDTWTAEVEKLTTAEIRAAFQRKLQPQNMVTVMVGAQP